MTYRITLPPEAYLLNREDGAGHAAQRLEAQRAYETVLAWREEAARDPEFMSKMAERITDRILEQGNAQPLLSAQGVTREQLLPMVNKAVQDVIHRDTGVEIQTALKPSLDAFTAELFPITMDKEKAQANSTDAHALQDALLKDFARAFMAEQRQKGGQNR